MLPFHNQSAAVITSRAQSRPASCLTEPGVDLTHILPDLDYQSGGITRGSGGRSARPCVGSPTAARRSGLDSAQRTNQISRHKLGLPEREAAPERQPGPMAALKLGAIRAPARLLLVVSVLFLSAVTTPRVAMPH